MSQLRWRGIGVLMLLALAWTAVGCTDDTTTPAVTSLGADGTFRCVAPDCCVPVDISVSKIILNRTEKRIGVDIVLGVPFATTRSWTAEVEVTPSWGTSVVCTATISTSTQSFVHLACPTLTFEGAPECDSSTTLTLRATTSINQDPQGKEISCAGQGRGQVKIPISLTCPSCPSSISLSDPCKWPNETCQGKVPSYLSTWGWGWVPCFCQLDTASGNYRWMCATT